MSVDNFNSNQDSQNHNSESITIIIDLEELFLKGHTHPEHDPGVIILYRIKLNDKYHNVHHSHLSGEAIMALDDKKPEHFILQQSLKEHGEHKTIVIAPTDHVSFKTPGIEKFTTAPKEYTFFIKITKDVEYKTHHSHLTVREILTDFAKVDPAHNTLAEKLTEFKNLDEKLDLTHVRHFIIFSERPTTVS